MSTMTFERAVERLTSLMGKGAAASAASAGSKKQSSLVEMHRYLDLLGLNVDELKVIHVAGSKGKGSVCAFVESVLRGAGLRTAMFTSPHLCDVRERIRINGVPVDREAFAEATDFCYSTLDAAVKRGELSAMPTYFRFLTLLGFRVSLLSNVDVTILEVGLGGRLDSTNVVRAPVVCGISSLELEHTAVLGNTIEQIAFEKGGIIKRGRPVHVADVQQPAALRVLRARADELDAPLRLASPLASGVPLGLAGEHQRINAGLAAALASEFMVQTRNEPLDSGVLTRGLASAFWPGRNQKVPLAQLPSTVFYLDGAHTHESMLLASSWFRGETQRGDGPPRRRIAMFYCGTERDPADLLTATGMDGLFDDVVLGAPRKAKPVYGRAFWRPTADSRETWQDVLARAWPDRSARLHTAPTFDETLATALRLARETEPGTRVDILVFGSLYLVGDALAALAESEGRDLLSVASSSS